VERKINFMGNPRDIIHLKRFLAGYFHPESLEKILKNIFFIICNDDDVPGGMGGMFISAKYVAGRSVIFLNGKLFKRPDGYIGVLHEIVHWLVEGENPDPNESIKEKEEKVWNLMIDMGIQ